MPGLYPLYAQFWDIGSVVNQHTTEARKFTQKLPFESDARLQFLECGPGTGIYTMEILRRFRNAVIVAIDNDASMLSVLERKTREPRYHNRVELVHGDVNAELLRLLGDGRQFDAAVMSGFLECLNDPVSVIKKVRALLAERGVLLNSAVRDTLFGKFIAWSCGAHPPRSRQQNIHMVTSQGFDLDKVEKLPNALPLWWIREVKEGHYFRKAEQPLSQDERFAA